MAMNKETQVSASTILDKEIYKQFKAECKKEKRSVSAQLSILVEQYLKEQETDQE